MPKIKRKSSDGMGVVVWWYDNGWRIARSPERPHTYRVETSSHFANYRYAGTWNTLWMARFVLKCQDHVSC